MIIEYYKGYIGYEQLAEMTKTGKNGTTAFHLIEAAKEIGFNSRGMKIDFEELHLIMLPCIAHVIINKSYSHYIVIYEINYKKKFIVVADPASGIKKISFLEFQNIWSKIVITFLPEKTIPILNNELNIKYLFLEIITSHKNIFVKAFIISFLTIVISIISSFSFKIMIEETMQNQNISFLFLLFIIFSFVELIKVLFDYIRNKILIFVSQKIDWVLTNDVYNKIISLPYCYYRNHTTGDIISRINDLKILKETMVKFIMIIFMDIPLACIACISLFLINKILFLVALLTNLSLLVLLFIFRPTYKKLIKNIHEKNSIVNSNMVEGISGFETVKGLGIQDNIVKKFSKNYYKLCSNSFKIQNLYNSQNILKNFFTDLGFLLIIYIGSLLVLKNNLSIGNLILFHTLLTYFFIPLQNVMNINMDIKDSKNALKRIFEIIPNESKTKYLANEFNGNIEYRNLTFTYNDQYSVLKNINLIINKGEKVLMIGHSGSGKSTLLKLLMKFYKVKKNNIFIDNIDINDYSNEIITDNICYISQNEMLFTDSLYNNLKLNRDIDDTSIKNIINLCCIDEIINKNNLGLNTLIEENGFNLSGGQRQRIILGRSLLKRFNVLIIDEGLSQMDISLERKILKNIFEYFWDKTIIVISHRLENMDLFERVIKLENNMIKEELIRNV